jgi:GxxExxY protein
VPQLLQKNEVYQAVGAAMDVYNELGSGFLEPVYQEAMEVELSVRDIQFSAQEQIPIQYKGRRLKKFYEPDLMLFGSLIVELKAQRSLSGIEQAQILNYLKATECRVGIVINFGCVHRLEWRRYVL